MRAGLALSCLIASGKAEAAPPSPLDVAWSDEASCPRPQDLEARVSQLIGAAPVEAEPARFEVRVSRSSQGLSLNARGQIGERTTERSVALASCGEAQEAAVLLIAMTLSPSNVAPEEREPAAREAASEARYRPGFGWGVQAAASADFLSLPGISAGPLLGVEFAIGVGRLGLEARTFLPRETGLGAGARADIGLTTFALTGGAQWRFGRIEFGPRIELEAGFLRGVARGVDDAKVSQPAWLGGLSGLLLEVLPTSRLSLQLAAMAGLPFRRPRFALEGEPPFYTAPLALIRLRLGICVWIDTKD